MHQPLALRCDAAALAGNFHHLQNLAGVPAGAAIKADAYGLGAREAARHLLDAGCRDFFVSTWWEAAELDFLPPDSLAVLHGLGVNDAALPGVRPVLVSPEQIVRWKNAGPPDAPCDVMIDTGMNRLGLRAEDIDLLEGLSIHTLHSHLACADEDIPVNDRQLEAFRALRSAVPAQRYSLANSAGILLGRDYAFDLVRPGLALYGGIPRAEGRGLVRQVATPEAQIIQLRTVPAGETVGYNATFAAATDTRIAIINIGYADGYWRGFSSRGMARFQGRELAVVGRVSMDLVALKVDGAADIREGDWVELAFDLEHAAQTSGMSQYELLTGLGSRFRRYWI
ncbi:alanine racemase [Sphingomonas rosea]|uniref:alanine racemase n=1 Tax=Sphingomonas rosea TaxID=335605 RepID=A0ABP7TJ21_9SPHN